MKKSAFFMFALCFLLLTACSAGEKNRESESEAYKLFLQNCYKNETENVSYFIKDLDGNGVDELITIQNSNIKITVYTFDGEVKELGNRIFYTGTTRLLRSDNEKYPGIIYFFVSGGADHYGYITIKNGGYSEEELWTDNYSAYPELTDERITKISENKELIAESKSVYEKDKDIECLPISAVS